MFRINHLFCISTKGHYKSTHDICIGMTKLLLCNNSMPLDYWRHIGISNI